jgi:hypothetical protein
MKTILILALVVCLGATASAQLSDQARLQNLTQSRGFGVKPVANPFSLLDLSRMRWHHSYSISFFSANGYSGSLGMFSSSMVYDVSSKLTVGVNLSLAHDVGSGLRSGDYDASFLPGFWLHFHPSKNVNMSLHVQRSVGWYAPFGYGGFRQPR